MTQNPEPTHAIRPLNVGNIVSTGLVLYRSHLKSYLGLAFTAMLWSLAPFVLLIVASPLLAVVSSQPGAAGSIVVLILFIGWVCFLWYAIAQYMLRAAVMSRLAFLELTSQPEGIHTAQEHLKPRLWRFLRVALQVGLRILLVAFGLYFAIALVVGILAGIAVFSLRSASFTPPSPIVLGIIGVSIGVIVLGLFFYGFLWYFSRWMIAELPLAIEENMSASESVDRSWQLTQGAVGRIIAVSSIAFLITLPITAITQGVPTFLILKVEQGSAQYWLIQGISIVMSFISGGFLLPFWQTTKAVLYADLRSRQEGLGLRLRER